ncbi:MAG: methyl-accepting chemotaxis protein [Deltaproteobacteria bacterium]|nr:methyl-accepting chemotaxis protein [Deltaproteobacteria bacterium]
MLPPNIIGNIIRKNFEIRFILSFCLIILIGAVAAGIAIYIFTHMDIGVAYPQARSALKDIKALLVPAVLITIIFQIIIITVIVALLTLLASHKIVGPLYRLSVGLKKTCNYDLTSSIRFRTTDPVGQLADIFNCMTGSLCHRIGQLEQRMLKIKDIERQLDYVITGDKIEKDKLEIVKKSFECEIAEIKKVLSEFKVG